MLRVSNIKMPVTHSTQQLYSAVAKELHTDVKKIISLVISKKSIDAREKNNIIFMYSVDITINNEEKFLKNKNISSVTSKIYVINKIKKELTYRPIVVGCGPSGIFAALILAESGCNPIVIERGKDVDARKKEVNMFWKHGILNEDSNAIFGEGGAGTFSDGKLTTGIKDERKAKVFAEFLEAGAPEEIAYLSKPHIGTDKLIVVLKNIRSKIISLGGEFRFENKFVNLQTDGNVKKITVMANGNPYILKTENLILAIGQSSYDTLEMLYGKNIEMEAKSFSVGVRIEHSQQMINKSQYGDIQGLGAADYKLNAHLPNGRDVYTFCMCPGGVVVASTSDKDSVVTNGMSYYSRDLPNANSALLVGVTPNDFSSKHPLAGFEFRRNFEKKAFLLGGGNYYAPMQIVEDFLNKKRTVEAASIIPSYKPGVTPANLSDCLDEFIVDSLRMGICEFNKKLSGFSHKHATLTGVETRSSSPVIIKRNNFFNSISMNGLFPCGEGAGYAGGIISAAVDGIRCAESIINALTQ